MQQSVDPHASQIKEICEDLKDCKFQTFSNVTLPNGRKILVKHDDCNIVGNCMEKILYPIIKESIPTFEEGPPGQKPDFINLGHDYELKCFNTTNGPGFDIGSITGFLEDISKPGGVQKKLDVKYLIFEYDITNKETKIINFWMLSVCDICCGYGGRKPINIGGGKGVNIRPATSNQWNKIIKEKRNYANNFLDRIEKLIQSDWYKVDESEKQQKLESIRNQREVLSSTMPEIFL